MLRFVFEAANEVINQARAVDDDGSNTNSLTTGLVVLAMVVVVGGTYYCAANQCANGHRISQAAATAWYRFWGSPSQSNQQQTPENYSLLP